jgi:manganese/zinc/iron transport system permease protein
MTELINLLLTDYTLQNVAAGSAILGIVSGSLGTFAFLRKESLMGDVVAHSALLGITCIFLLFYAITGTGSKNEALLMLGAVVSGIVAMIFVSRITSHSRIKNDSAMGIILAIFFGSGMFLLTMIQQSDISNKSGLAGYIFGSAATMSHDNVILMGSLGLAALIIMTIFWKEFKIHTFDTEFAHTSGFSIKLVDAIMISVIVIAIVIGLQAVGVILMVAMIVAPASAARQWTNKLWVMVVISAFFGMISGIVGALSSSLISNLPTGPMIVLTATAIFIFSVLFSPNRGIISTFLRNFLNNRKFKLSLILNNLYLLSLNHNFKDNHGHSSKVISTMTTNHYSTKKSLLKLSKLGLVSEITEDNWMLTNEGIIKAKSIHEQKGELID